MQPVQSIRTPKEPLVMKVVTEEESQNTLGLTIKQLDRMIEKTEADIVEQAALVEKETEPFKEMEKLYLEQKKIFDGLNVNLEESKELLTTLAQLRSRTKNGKDIRVMRTTSHTAKPPKEEKPRFQWRKLATDALTKMDRFLEPSRVWDIVMQEMGIDSEKMPNDVKKHRWMTLVNWRKQFVVYNDRMGLAIWVDKENRPTGKYLEAFMQQG